MSDTLGVATYPFKLPALRHDYGALEPYFDERTMRLHHDRHHKHYVDALNAALKDLPQLHGKGLAHLLSHIEVVPAAARTAVVNNGGGHANHQLLWKVIGPEGTKPEGLLLAAIKSQFDSLENFKNRFTEAAVKQFASGWTFLALDPASDRLEIVSLPNHGTLHGSGKRALLVCDVWEHAYYLKYENRRPEFVQAFWHVVDWNAVGERLVTQHEALRTA